MANTKQAAKRARQSEKHRQNNRWQKTRMTSAIKAVYEAIEKKDVATAQTLYRTMSSLVDRMATKGHIHKNKAARHKSRLNAHIKALVMPAATAA